MFSGHSPHVSVVSEQGPTYLSRTHPLHTTVSTLNQAEDGQEEMNTMLRSR